MGVDVGIYGNLLRAPRSAQEYMNDNLQTGALQQNLLASRMQMQQQQGAVADQNALRQYLAGGDTGEALEKGLSQRGFLKESLLVGKDRRENQKTEADTTKTRIEGAVKAMGAQRDMLAMVNTPQDAAQWVQAAYANPDLQPVVGRFGSVEQMVARIPQDPAQFAEWKRANALGAENFIKQADVLRGQDIHAATTMRGQDMTDKRTRDEGAAGRAVTMRGQNMSDARARELNGITREAAAAAKKESANDKAVTKFSDTIQKEGIPELETAISAAEGAVGRYPKGQVPGVGPLKNILPQAVMSDEGKDVRQALAQVRNIVLSARSGAAVTDQELRRLVEEIGTGAGMTEDDMRRGLAKVRERIEHIKTNAAAGVSDDVLGTYKSRGGIDIKRGNGASGLSPAEQAELDQLRARFGKK